MKQMKIFALLMIISVLFLDSCSVLDKYELSVNSINLAKFDKEGIYVTTGDLSKDYKSISLIEARCYTGYFPKSGHEKKSDNKNQLSNNYDDTYASSSSSFDNPNNFDIKECTLDDLFTQLIDQAKKVGANGIIKLEIRNISRTGISRKNTQNGIEVIGLAINIRE